MERVLRICLVMGLLILNGSCSRDAETSNLSIQLPKSGQIFQSVNAQSSGGFNTSLNPTSLAEINCYGIFVGGSTPDVNSNFCADTTSSVEKFRFGPSSLFHPAGSLIELDVPSGPNREIILAGMKTQNGSCVTFPQNSGGNPDTSNMSTPHILARKIVDLQPGDQTEQITASFNTSDTFDDCNFFSGGGGGGGGGGPMFGDGRDGDITISGAVTMSSQALNGGALSHTPATGGTASSKKMSAHRRIANISADGLTITSDTTFTANDFEVGDEVIMHITAASDSANQANADTHCGSNLFIGMFDFAKIVDTPDNQTIVVDNPLNNSSSFNSTGISATNAKADSNFCRMQIVRVPNFNVITVSAASIITQDPYLMSGGNGSGGLIAFRAKEVNLTIGSLNVEANALGFQGQGQAQAETGESIHGQPGTQQTFNQIANAGQGSSVAGGGGGGAGTGGQGSQQAGLGGQAIDFCPGPSACLPMQDKKIFFGGSGGATFSELGNDGGGAAVVHVGRFTGGNTFTIEANGASASTDAGGGGGGAVHLTYKENASGAVILANARGGDGQQQQQPSGNGGGGSVEVARCAAQAQQQPQVSVSPGVAGVGGTVGIISNADAPTVCSEPL